MKDSFGSVLLKRRSLSRGPLQCTGHLKKSKIAFPAPGRARQRVRVRGQRPPPAKRCAVPARRVVPPLRRPRSCCAPSFGIGADRLGVGPPPLDGHAGESGEEDEHQRRQQAGHHLVPPRPPNGPLPAARRPGAGSSGPSRNRRRSSASASAVAYRCCRVALHRLQDDRLQVAGDPRREPARAGRVLVQESGAPARPGPPRRTPDGRRPARRA